MTQFLQLFTDIIIYYIIIILSKTCDRHGFIQSQTHSQISLTLLSCKQIYCLYKKKITKHQQIINSKHVHVYYIILPLNVDKLFCIHLLVLVLLNSNQKKIIPFTSQIIHKKKCTLKLISYNFYIFLFIQ